MPDQNATRQHISNVCDELKTLLLRKNEAYGNSVLEPVQIFCKEDPMTQIRVRIDDKLSRIMKGKEFPGDDTIMDLLGYLVLYRVAMQRHQ